MAEVLSDRYRLTSKRGPVSLIAVIVLSAFALCLLLTISKFTDPIGSDVTCYYNYLPALFNYHSFEFNTLPLRYGFVQSPEGFVVEKTTMGMAFLYLPFYLVAWVWVKLAGLSQMEYSTPFALALTLSAIFYFVIGLIFLRKILLNFFSDIITTLGLVTIFLGTNLVYYTSYEGPMSHVYTFCLVAVFIWLVMCWHQDPSWKVSVPLGLTSGLLALIRPTTVITIVLFAVLYALYDWPGLKLKGALIWKNIPKILAIAGLALIVWIPQMLYWKSATGKFLFFSYTGERFFWNQPLIHLGLFSYRCGWLMYGPVMIFSIIGFFFMNKELKRFRWATIIIFAVTIYVIYSWWCWWWVGLGSRAMIEIYPLLAISLCAFLSWLFTKKNIVKIPLMTVFGAMLLFGLFKDYQYKHGLCHYDGMNKKAYWNVFLKTEVPEGYWGTIKSPDYEAAKRGDRIQ